MTIIAIQAYLVRIDSILVLGISACQERLTRINPWRANYKDGCLQICNAVLVFIIFMTSSYTRAYVQPKKKKKLYTAEINHSCPGDTVSSHTHAEDDMGG